MPEVSKPAAKLSSFSSARLELGAGDRARLGEISGDVTGLRAHLR